MFKNFFRKDLSLERKWWHRLFQVIFGCFVLLAFVSILNVQLPKYAPVADLYDRLDSTPRNISDLVKEDERLSSNEILARDGMYEKWGGWILKQPKVICSTNIDANIESISRELAISLYEGEYSNKFISLEEYREYLKEVEALCIEVRSLDSGSQALGWAWFVDSDLKIWKESWIPSVLYVLTQIPLIVFCASITVFLYYKVFLYVIFGTSKNHE